MKYAVGSLVEVRKRTWVVQPSPDDWYILQPLGGCAAEQICVSPAFETITEASFTLPNPDHSGDNRSCALLRDAVRLANLSTSGPFRSFGRIAVEPRPYQLVPLLMAMKQAMVRLLIADDVGIGKTIEAGLIVRELMDRGEIKRLAVLCPPPLAEQWQEELATKFHIHCELVLAQTVHRLERHLGLDQSIFEAYPFTIVSLDYIKSEHHRDEFLRVCPECVIVDEAHACASHTGTKTAQQRFHLIQHIANPAFGRHMIFITATPHSGKDDVFHSLLSFLNPHFSAIPDDLKGKENTQLRQELSQYVIQRRRADIAAYMDAQTTFPKRLTGEMTWRFSPKEKAFYEKGIALARESLQLGEGQTVYTQHLFWWSALALLRALSSSPAAAKATLRNRSVGLDQEGDDIELLDAEGALMLQDATEEVDAPIVDTLVGADMSDSFPESNDLRQTLKRKYKELAQEAETLEDPSKDSKLKKLVEIVKKLLDDQYSPIIFCRFIHTAQYVRTALGIQFPQVAVMAVTGQLPPEERENRVRDLKQSKKRILVCTDCLSEGINLQDAFNAIVHYDLSWNPTRHEQREGRVDRFGQAKASVKVITLYGENNPIDGYVLDVLLRKHEAIRKALGISVPFPENSDKVMQAILTSVLLRKEDSKQYAQKILPGLEDFFATEKKQLQDEWDALAAREEKRSRTVFAQQAIKVEAVAQEVAASREAVGDAKTVANFVQETVQRLGGQCQTVDNEVLLTFDEPTRAKHQELELPQCLHAVFEEPAVANQEFLQRSHPFVQNLANFVFETAMDASLPSFASRSGVIRTHCVEKRTSLILCRFRYELCTTGQNTTKTDLTEECVLLAFAGQPAKAEWFEPDVQTLLAAQPEDNVDPQTSHRFLTDVLNAMDCLMPHIKEEMQNRAQHFLHVHRRIRDASKLKGIQYTVTPKGEPDILGIYVYLPLL